MGKAMNLYNIVNTVSHSSPEDWHRVMDWTAGLAKSNKNTHEVAAVFIPEPSISLAWGLVFNKDFQEPWANRFPSREAVGCYADVRLHGSVVFRTPYVEVDGSRAMLPLPAIRETPEGFIYEIIEGQYRFFRALGELEYHHDLFARYFHRSGLRLVEGTWPPFAPAPVPVLEPGD